MVLNLVSYDDDYGIVRNDETFEITETFSPAYINKSEKKHMGRE